MEELNSPISFPPWLQRRRKALDLTQDELSKRVGCSIGALRKIERGERRPSKQLAELLAKILEIPTENQKDFIRFARGEAYQGRQRHMAQEPLPQTSSMQEQRGSQPDAVPEAPLASPALPSSVPIPSTPLIGREPELDSLGRLFRDPQCRLLTLTGVGGIGKTRLAIEFAIREIALFPGGVFYFPFTPVDSLEKIVAAIADVLGFGFSGLADPQDQLLNFISSNIQQDTLFIFDNLEHLLVLAPKRAGEYDVVALISEILQLNPNIKILGTSREHLNISGEWTYEMHGLSIPTAEFDGSLEDYDATALFIKSARRISMNTQMSADERLSIIQICQLVAGVPLAIELAAVWVGMLSCREIAQEIQSNMDFLRTSMRDIPERHRSIRATFDHSWRLLSGEERWTLCQLAVFQGGFDRHAAYRVAGASLSILSSLVTKSLVRRTASGRFDLHEVIQQYAMVHLREDPRCHATHQRHSEYYLALMREHENSFRSASQQEAYQQLTNEIDNIRAAWAWAIDHDQFDQLGQSGRAFGYYFEIAGLHQQGIEQLDLLVQALKARPPEQRGEKVMGLALINQALLFFRKGDPNTALNLYHDCIKILRPLGDQTLLADALIFSGIIMHLKGDYAEAISSLKEGLDLARAGKQFWFEAYAIYNLGYIDSLMGRYIEGAEQMLDGLATWRRLGDPHYIALGLNFLAPTLIKLGRIEEAKADVHESISLCMQTKNRWGLGNAYRYLGMIMMAANDGRQAKIYLLKSLEIFSDYFTGWDKAISLAYLGDASMLDGDAGEARKNYLDALLLSINSRAIPVALHALSGLASLQAQGGNKELALGLCYLILSHSASEADTKTRAERLLASLEAELSPTQLETAHSYSQGSNFDAIAEEILQTV